jgi:hypothetical protein
VGAIVGVLGDFSARSMDTYGVIYPYWENAARLNETRMAVCLFFFLLLALFPFGCLCVLGWRLLKRGGRLLKTAAVRAKDGISDRIYYKRVEKRKRSARRPEEGKEKRPAERV